ncbi:hypothetical protein ZIOFF_063764 [Zingiber officinale]|uniref:GDSL esterase/lipase n=1 Tax=Zingiber officinale TaxID=94328 RepID=A0A8J5KGH5_ZINOF|nr:hypothetical protein ZIOFF_063764 [Zingiber officinale]
MNNLLRFAHHLLLLLLLCYLRPSSSSRYDALFNFGDSMSDTGNVQISTLPYGMTFFGNATGRCSDGRLVIDFIGTSSWGFPCFRRRKRTTTSGGGPTSRWWPPPPSPSTSSTTATSARDSGSTPRSTSKSTASDASSPPSAAPLKVVAPPLSPLAHRPFDEITDLLLAECKEFLRRSLFIVGEFGGNDYSTALFFARPVGEVSTFVPHVIDALRHGVERLIELGAVDLVVPGVLPVGCFPLYLTNYRSLDPDDYGPRTGCARRYNALSWLHNTLLRRALDQLRRKHPAVSIRYADYYSQIIDIAVDPSKYGFTDGALRTCCGGGDNIYNYDQKRRCNEKNYSVCANVSTHVNWDGIHMTEAAHRVIADGWLRGPYVDPPILISSSS